MPRRTQDTARVLVDFVYRACTFCGRAFNPVRLSTNNHFPRSYNPAPVCGLGFSDFARHYFRNHFCFLFLQVLRCFNSLGCLLITYVFSHGYPSSSTWMGSPIRIPPDRCLCTTPRGVSPFSASFFCSICQVPRHPPYALLHLIT